MYHIDLECIAKKKDWDDSFSNPNRRRSRRMVFLTNESGAVDQSSDGSLPIVAT